MTLANPPVSNNDAATTTPGAATPATHPRERLVLTAVALVQNQGWNATGINQILSEAGIPKGSFYYYFRSKEALGVAVLKHHGQKLKSALARSLLNLELAPEQALERFFQEWTAASQKDGRPLGCPIGALAAEVATQSPALLAEAQANFRMMEQAWEALLARAGIPAPEESARAAAMMAQGALLASRCAGDSAPLKEAQSALRRMLFGAKARAAESAIPRIAPRRPDGPAANGTHALAS